MSDHGLIMLGVGIAIWVLLIAAVAVLYYSRAVTAEVAWAGIAAIVAPGIMIWLKIRKDVI